MQQVKKKLWSIAAVFMSSALVATAYVPAFALTSSPMGQQGLTTKLATVGDSISIGVNVRLAGPDAAMNWSTGTDPAVKSIRQRIESISGQTVTGYHAARAGAASSTVVAQTNSAIASGADTVTMLMGANDACRPSVSMMTPVATYQGRISSALDALEAADVRVVVASIPSLMELYETGKDSSRARYMWNRYNICASMLADPMSTAQADIERRQAVERRVQDFNAVLASECASRANCAYDNGAVYATQTSLRDLSPLDYFHPSVSGQNKIAAAVWPTYQTLYLAAASGGSGTYAYATRNGGSTSASTISRDVTAPTISITAPTSGTTVSGMVTVRAVASDDTEVTRVKFYSGRVLLGTAMLNGDEWTRTYNTARLPDGTYSLTAKAYDAAGNVGVSSTVRVTVVDSPQQESSSSTSLSTRIRNLYSNLW